MITTEQNILLWEISNSILSILECNAQQNCLMKGNDRVKGSGAKHQVVWVDKVQNSQCELRQVYGQWFSPCVARQLSATLDSTQDWTPDPATSLNALSRWRVRHELKYVAIIIEQIKYINPLMQLMECVLRWNRCENCMVCPYAWLRAIKHKGAHWVGRAFIWIFSGWSMVGISIVSLSRDSQLYKNMALAPKSFNIVGTPDHKVVRLHGALFFLAIID